MKREFLREDGFVFRHPFAVTALACFASALLFDYSANRLTTLSAILLAAAAAALVALAVYWLVNGMLTPKRAAFLILAFSFLIKLIYVLCTGVGERQHDVGSFKLTSNGHAGMIMRMWNGEFFPPKITSMWYHPPLHYALEALWMRLITLRGVAFETARCYATALTLFYSCASALVCLKLFGEFKLKETTRNMCLALVAFHPSFIILSASYNNDMLSVLFMLAALLFAVRWYRRPGYGNTVALALAIGLGMMTKLSAAYVAPATAVLFLVKFVQSKGERARLFRLFCVFGAVCIPLGTWWSFYLRIAHGLPFGYVMRLDNSLPQYIGQYSVVQRLFGIPHSFSEGIWFARGDYGYSFYEYNIPSAIVKTSVFGEWQIGKGGAFTELLAHALVILNAALILFSLWCAAGALFKKKNVPQGAEKWFIYLFWLTVMGLYVKFCFDFPHNCTMDFRYIVPTTAVGALLIGVYTDSAESKWLKRCAAGAIYAFCAVSALLYSVCA